MNETKSAVIRGAIVGGILLGACVLGSGLQELAHGLYPLDVSGDELSRNIHRGGQIGSAGISLAAALVVLALLVWPWFRPTSTGRAIIVGAAVVLVPIGTFFMGGLAVLTAALALALLYAYATADLLPHDAKLGSRLGVAFGSIGGLLLTSVVPALMLEQFLRGILGAAGAGFIATLALGNIVLKVLLKKRDTEAIARAPGALPS